VEQDIRDYTSNQGTNDFVAGAKLGDIIAIYVWGITNSPMNSFLEIKPITNPKDFVTGIAQGLRFADNVEHYPAC